MRLSRFCIAVAMILLWSSFSWAQSEPNLETGFKPYGSYQHDDFDSVSLTSGALVLHIPSGTAYPQRGGRLNGGEHLFINSKAFSVKLAPENSSIQYWSQGSWSPAQMTSGNPLWPNPTRSYNTVSVGSFVSAASAINYVLTSGDGSQHPLGDVTPAAGSLESLETEDGSGWHLDLTTADANNVPSSGFLRDRQGNVYPVAFALGRCTSNSSTVAGVTTTRVNCQQSGLQGSVTDGNGNTYSLSTLNVATLSTVPGADTMGRAPVYGTAPTPASPVAPGCVTTGDLPLSYSTTFNYPGPNGASSPVTLCYATLNVQTNFGVSGVDEYPNQWAGEGGAGGPNQTSVVVAVLNADGSKWTLSYNSYGDVTSISLPLGGSISYQWQTVAFPNCSGTPVSRAVTQRTITDNNGHSYVWNYQWVTQQSNPASQNGTYTNVSTDPLGNDTVHVFTNYSSCSFYETTTQAYQGPHTAGTLLRQVNTAYTMIGSAAVPISIQTTVYPSGQVNLVTKTYDSAVSGIAKDVSSFGKVLVEKEYDWGQGSPGPLLRETDYTYQWQNNSAYLSAHMLDLPASVIVKDGNGNKLAETDYTPDEPQYLTASNISTQHGAPPNSVRGNLTTASKWLNTGGAVVTHSNWYDTGEVFQTLDALGNATTHSYDPYYDGAYSTKTTNALGQTVSGTYDFTTGLLTSFTNANATQQASGNTPGDSAHTVTYSYDFMSRLTQALFPPDPGNNGAQAQTSFQYPNPISLPFTVTKTHSITPSLSDSVTSTYDGLGRVYKTQHPLPNGTAEVDTTYDALDHVLSVTNPYFSSSDPTYGVIQTQYDALGRVTQTTKQDGSVVSAAYDVFAPSGVSGNCTVSTDEAGHSRRACSDGLGRLIEVDEPGDPIINFNGAAAPATAVYSMTGFPDSYGEHDLYVGTDQHIYQLLLTSSGWVNQDLTAVTNGELAASHSAMTSFTDSFGEHILYVGANQHLYQLFFATGSGWQNQDLTSTTGNTLAALTTGLSSFADSNGEHVLYVGSNQHVNELLFVSGSGWTNQDLTAGTGNTLAAAATGFTNFADSYGEHVFYEGANQHVYQLYFNSGVGWQNQDLTGSSNPPAAAPTAFSSLIDSYGEHVFYFGSNQHLEQLYFTAGTGWVNQDLTGMTGNTLAAVGSSLSSFSDSMGEHAFYQGTNQHVYTMYFNGSAWSNQDLTAMTGSAAATSGGGLAGYSNGQGEYVFYDGGSQGVYELSWAAGSPWEATNIGGPSLAQNYYVTQYSYDALGNLLNVTQKGDPTVASSSQYRVRTFSYDSLSRLLTATNPESGTISYSYDADGNVLQKTSPAPNQTGAATQTISYCYDALNRIMGKVYSAQSCPLSSPVVSYGYDAGANGIGHLTSLVDAAGTGSYSYDALGRITSEQRTIANIQKNLRYAYNLDNSVAKLTYPSGAVVTYTPDSAGRMLSAVDSGNNINYVTSASYGPDSPLTGFVSGSSSSFNGISNSWQYNQRLQICRITALTTGSSPTSCTDSAHTGNVLDLGYNLSLGAGDNGNVIGITNYKDNTRSQSFTYDALNRLTSAQNAGTNCNQMTAAGAGEYWGNSYGYDAWGNLLQKAVTKCNAENLSVTALANNQLSSYGYDAAGNMTHDATTGNSYNFDAENRITGAAGYTYTYDDDGNRVEKSNGSAGTIYWYMTPGIVAESDLSGNLKSEYVFFDGERIARKDFPTNAVSYYFSDHLKTASVITNSAGVITEDEDFYPWGGEVPFVNSDSNHYKFGGHERDSETGLDYMLARYYSNPLGRFLTPDWAAKPITVPYANFGNPQSLNLYTYGKNNPTTFGDPDGHLPRLQDIDWKRIGQDLADAAKTIWNAAGHASPMTDHSIQAPQGGTCICPGGADQNNDSKQNNSNSYQQNSKADQLKANGEKGKDFEKSVVDATKKTDSNVVEQVTIKTESGVKTRMDVVSTDASGQIKLQEAKSSATAPLTPNQTAAHPEIQQTGGTVVGQGKPGYPGGTQVPPTKVDVVRPPQQ